MCSAFNRAQEQSTGKWAVCVCVVHVTVGGGRGCVDRRKKSIVAKKEELVNLTGRQASPRYYAETFQFEMAPDTNVFNL